MTIGYGSTVTPEVLAMEEDMLFSSNIRTQADRARELSSAYYAGQNSDGEHLNAAILSGDTEVIAQIISGAIGKTDAAGIASMKHHLQQIVRLSNPAARPANMRATPSWGQTTMHGYTEF